jgi:hypothetical protein
MRSSLNPVAPPFYPSSMTDFNTTTIAMDLYDAYYANTHTAYMDTYNPPTYYNYTSASAYSPNPYYAYAARLQHPYHTTNYVYPDTYHGFYSPYAPSSPTYPYIDDPTLPASFDMWCEMQDPNLGKGDMGKGVTGNAGKFKSKKKKNKGWKRKDAGEGDGGWKKGEEEWGAWKRGDGGEERGRTMARRGDEGAKKTPMWEW